MKKNIKKTNQIVYNASQACGNWLVTFTQTHIHRYLDIFSTCKLNTQTQAEI